jgi:hypothetical protein
MSIDLSPVFAFPSTLSLDSIELHDQTIIVHLHATAPTAACPHCGTAGSRVHSRYERTIADVAFGRRCLVLKLLVRKWICPEASCSQCIFAERFPELVQRYARMTDRLIEALQAVGVTTNGADAAQIVSSLGMPTTAKTIIRRVLRLVLPQDGTVRIAGIDEWAWKKGSRYGTILVDLEQRCVADLLEDAFARVKYRLVSAPSRGGHRLARSRQALSPSGIGFRSPGETRCRSISSSEEFCRSTGEVLWSPQASAQKSGTAACWKDTSSSDGHPQAC